MTTKMALVFPYRVAVMMEEADMGGYGLIYLETLTYLDGGRIQ